LTTGVPARIVGFALSRLGIRHRSKALSALTTLALVVVIGVLAAGPILLVAANSFVVSQPGEPERVGLDAWRTLLAEPGLLQSLANTVALAITRVAIGVPVAVLIIWLLVRTNVRAAGVIEFLFWIAFFLPGVPVTLGWILLLDPNYGLFNELLAAVPLLPDGTRFDIFSFWGIVLVELLAGTIPAQVIIVAPAFRIFDSTLEQSSRVAGGTIARTLRTITLPLLMPTIAVASVLAFVRAMEGFEVEQLLGVPAGIEVYSTRIYRFMRFDPPQFAVSSALGTLLLLIMLPLVLVQARRRFSRSEATISGREHSIARIPLGRWRLAATLFCLIPAVLGSVLPLTLLIVGSFMKLWGFFDIPQPFTLANWQGVLTHPYLLVTLRNALILGLGSATVGVLGLTAVAYLIARRPGRMTGLLSFLTWLPWFLPGMLLGLGLLWALLGNPLLRPLHGTMFGLILAMVIKEMPVAVQIMRGSISQIGLELEQASAVAGGSSFRTFTRIVLPLVAPTAVSVGVLILLASVRDVSTVLLLATQDVTPVSVLVLQYSVTGEFERASVVGLIVSAIVIVLAFIGRRISSRVSIR
jgi:iron(III) transport system permease protein